LPITWGRNKLDRPEKGMGEFTQRKTSLLGCMSDLGGGAVARIRRRSEERIRPGRAAFAQTVDIILCKNFGA